MRSFPKEGSMSEQLRQPYWVLLFEDFNSHSDPPKLKARLEALEGAMFERLQELNGTAEGHQERLALQMAAAKLLEIKTTKLGFPPVPGLTNGTLVA
jgi:hypothetical protein